MQLGKRKSTRWGLLQRKEKWALTPLAWAVLCAAMVGLVLWGSAAIHPFFALTQPIDADALIVEGWLPDYALEGAVREFHSRPYQCLITTGGPIDAGETIASYKTYAALCAATLSRLGVDSSRIIAVPSPRLEANRTFVSALALNRWLAVSGATLRSFNLYSLGVHTRRSRLLFQKALGNAVPLGSIAAKDFSYNPDRWWRYSSGVEAVIFESVGYFYVKALFPFSAEHALNPN
jgi:hypothetical protein